MNVTYAQKLGVKHMLITIDLTQPLPKFRVEVSMDGVENISTGEGLSIDVAMTRAFRGIP